MTLLSRSKAWTGARDRHKAILLFPFSKLGLVISLKFDDYALSNFSIRIR